MTPIPNNVPDRPIQTTTTEFAPSETLSKAGNWQRRRHDTVEQMEFVDRAWTKAKMGGDGLRLTKTMK